MLEKRLAEQQEIDGLRRDHPDILAKAMQKLQEERKAFEKQEASKKQWLDYFEGVLEKNPDGSRKYPYEL
jgi:phage-related minor tail protein